MSRAGVLTPTKGPGPILINGKQFLGTRDAKKVAALFAEIAEDEKTAVKLLLKTAQAYYDAGNILAAAIQRWNYKAARLTAKAVADASSFAEQRIALALKIFKLFEHSPSALTGLSFRDVVKLLAPPPSAGVDGYNRIDLGGDPGQMKFDFGDLFERPADANPSLTSYRTLGDLVSEIIVVHVTKEGKFISKSFARFCEDIPQNPSLRLAYKTMSQKTQAAIEDYLAALEHEEEQR